MCLFWASYPTCSISPLAGIAGVTGANSLQRLDWRNLNTLWGSILAETLSRLGCRVAVVCPGSRSAPLTYALAQHPEIEAIPAVDERSAAFFALGLAQQTRQPIPLVCTSGSAGAHFFPALIEAAESGWPGLSDGGIMFMRTPLIDLRCTQ